MTKYLSLAAIVAVASLAANAAVPTNSAPFHVVVPCLENGFNFVLEGLYLQPTTSDTIAALISETTILPNSNQEFDHVKMVNPSYNFGFRIGAGYTFKNSGNDVQASWTNFSHSSSNTIGPMTGTSSPTIDVDGIPLNTGDIALATGTADLKYNAVDLNVGQYLDVGTRLRTRLFAGLEFAQLEDNVMINANSVLAQPSQDNIVAQSLLATQNSKFTGVGPQFGIDTSYHIKDCFGLVAHVAGALLVGQLDKKDSDLAITTSFFAPTPDNIFEINNHGDSTTLVVPALEGRLGIDYTLPISDKSQLGVEAGYQTTQYIDVFTKLGIADGTKSSSGMGLNGPYLNLSYKM